MPKRAIDEEDSMSEDEDIEFVPKKRSVPPKGIPSKAMGKKSVLPKRIPPRATKKTSSAKHKKKKQKTSMSASHTRKSSQKRTFTVVSYDGDCVGKSVSSGYYKSKSPSGAASKAATQYFRSGSGNEDDSH